MKTTQTYSSLGIFLSILALTACSSEEGEQGAQGEQGDQGEPGPQGAPGDDGDPGAKGEEGEQGQEGPRGEDGEPGPQGDPGQDGDPGEEGEDGDDGEDGLDADIIEGSFTAWVKEHVAAIKAGTEDVGEYLPLPNRLTDTVETARGLQSNVVVRWMDPLTFGTASEVPRFGANGDFTAFFGDQTGGFGALYEGSSSAGWLWSNHEYISGDPPNHVGGGAAPNSQALQFSHFLKDRGMLSIADVSVAANWVGATADQETYIEWSKRQVGGSWFRVVQDPGSGEWTVDRSATSKRYDATDATQVAVVGMTLSDAATVVSGTQNNCSGAHTPWGTVLSGEENVQDYFGDLETFFNDNGAFTADPSGTANASPGGDITLDYTAVASSVYGRNPDATQVYPKDHYGYLTEFDVGANANAPYDSTTGNGHQKLGAMGRARWENATFVTGEDWKLVNNQPLVIYAGDDRRGGRIFKFVSSSNWTTGMTKSQTRNLLASGKLYVAHFTDLKNDGTGLTIAGDVTPTAAAPGNGVWIELSVDNTTQDAPNAATLGAGTKVGAALTNNTWNNMGAFVSNNQVKSVLYTASNKLGVRELNRPEDLEYNPFHQAIYIAFTNHNRGTALDNNGVLRGVAGGTVNENLALNTGRPDRNGAVFTLKEATPAAPGSSVTFTFWASWLGVRSASTTDPFIASCPDNIVIDPDGGVWFGTDGNPGNNNRADALYYLDTEERKAYRVAAAPSDAEATGPTFTPDGATLFFNVQHPGESWYSAWPGDSEYGPLSSLVAITPQR